MTRLNDVMGMHDVDTPVVLTTPHLRAPLAQALTKVMSRIAVLSVAEIPANMNVQTLARVGLRDAG
jgi:flagellar biosynthesis protein FlhA